MSKTDLPLKEFIRTLYQESGLRLTLNNAYEGHVYASTTNDSFDRYWFPGVITASSPGNSNEILVCILGIKTRHLCPKHLSEILSYITRCQEVATSFSRAQQGYIQISVYGELCGPIDDETYSKQYLEFLCPDNLMVGETTKETSMNAIKKLGIADEMWVGE